MIKRISDPSERLAGPNFRWPLRPEVRAKSTAKLAQDRIPDSLHSVPLGHKHSKGEVQ